MESLEVVNLSILASTNITGIIFNAILIYMISTRSPKQIKSYSFLLLNTACTDLLYCCFSLFTLQRVIINSSDFFYISSGVCQLFGAKACYNGYLIMLSLYSHTNWSLIASFSFRLLVLSRDTPSRGFVCLGLTIIAIPSVILYSTLVGLVDEHLSVDVYPMIEEVHPELNLTERTVYGCFGVAGFQGDWRPVVANILVLGPVIPIFLAVVFIRRSIVLQLRRQRKMSKRTKKLHGQLLLALSLQMCLPLLYCFNLICHGIVKIFDIHNIFAEYAPMIFISIIPTVSPLLPLYFVSAYRQCLRKLWKSKESVEKTSLSNSNSDES